MGKASMIEFFNWETMHRHGSAFPDLLKLRYSLFICEMDYAVPSYKDMEYDQYDTPAAVYVVWRDEEGRVRGGRRLVPTCVPYMIKDLWGEAISGIKIPESPDIWEATRVVLDARLSGEQRKRARGELMCSILEFALTMGISAYIGVAEPEFWKFTFDRFGWQPEKIGPETTIRSRSSEPYREECIQACRMPVSPEILAAVRAKTNIADPLFVDQGLLDTLRRHPEVCEQKDRLPRPFPLRGGPLPA